MRWFGVVVSFFPFGTFVVFSRVLCAFYTNPLGRVPRAGNKPMASDVTKFLLERVCLFIEPKSFPLPSYSCTNHINMDVSTGGTRPERRHNVVHILCTIFQCNYQISQADLLLCTWTTTLNTSKCFPCVRHCLNLIPLAKSGQDGGEGQAHLRPLSVEISAKGKHLLGIKLAVHVQSDKFAWKSIFYWQ